MSATVSPASSSMADSIDIIIHLYPSRQPDPTTWSDYVVVLLLVLIGAGFVFFAQAINLLAKQWPILKWINLPMLIAMSAFSSIHLIAVFLTESYFEPLTLAVDSGSCVIVPFWLEYMLGLGGFSAILILRLVYMCMVLFPLCFADTRRIRIIIMTCVLVCTHGPLFVICMMVSIGDGTSIIYEPYTHCTTLVGYRIAVVVWLLYVLCVIVALTIAVRNAIVAKMEVEVVVDVVKVSVTMLALGSILHFLYLLSYWWGRFIFMLTVCILHTYAYYRYVLPVWVEYTVHGTDEARKASAARMAQMLGPIEFVLQSTLQVTPKSMLAVPELRKSFFEYIGSLTDVYANIQTMTVKRWKDISSLDAPVREEYHDIAWVLNYYEILRQLGEYTDVTKKLDDHYQKVCKLHAELVQTHLHHNGREYLHMDNGTRNVLIHAIAHPDHTQWNFDIFASTAKNVATMLCDALSDEYTNAEYGAIIRIQEERSRQLRMLHQLELYEHTSNVDTSTFVSETEEYAGVCAAIIRCCRAPQRSRKEVELDELLAHANDRAADVPMHDGCETVNFSDAGQFDDSPYEIRLDGDD